MAAKEDKFMQKKSGSREEPCKTISLDSIIRKFLQSKGAINNESGSDSSIVTLRRTFYRLLERLGSDREVLKENGKYLFAEEEAPFMMALLTQLYDNHGIIADFVNGTKKGERFSAREVHEFLDTLKEEIEKAESDEKKYDYEDMYAFFVIFFFGRLCVRLKSVINCSIYSQQTCRTSLWIGNHFI